MLNVVAINLYSVIVLRLSRMSAAPLVANLITKVSALSTTAVQPKSSFICDIKGDVAWAPAVPMGHTAYTWGVKGFSSQTAPVSQTAAPVKAAEAPKPASSAAAPKAAAAKETKEPKKEAAPVAAISGTDADFYLLDLRVAKATNVRDHPGAESLYLFDAIIGSEAPVQVVTNLKKSMSKTELEGKMFTMICNLKPNAIRGEKSFAMILGIEAGLALPIEGATAGDRLFLEGQKPTDVVPGRANEKVVTAVTGLLAANPENQLTWNGKVVVATNGPVNVVPSAH